MPSLVHFPTTLPAAEAKGHDFQPLPNARARDRDQGERRMRPRYRRTPDLCSVVWTFWQAELDVFHAWFEDEIEVGATNFDVQVANRDAAAGATWWTARFVRPYDWQELPGLRYQVRAQLLLLEEIGPDWYPPGIVADSLAWHLGEAVLAVPPLFVDGLLDHLGEVMPFTVPLMVDGLLDHLGEAAIGVVIDGGDLERLWAGMASTPVAGDEINRATQEHLQRAWMGVNDGVS